MRISISISMSERKRHKKGEDKDIRHQVHTTTNASTREDASKCVQRAEATVPGETNYPLHSQETPTK